MTKNNFLKTGDVFSPTNEQNLVIHPHLPIGTYSVGFTPAGFFLKQIEDITVSGKLYGDVEMRTARVLNTFEDRPSTTGLMLKGEKGSGKTLLARNICQEARKLGIITLVVNTPFAGEEFNNFIAGIEQPCIVMFDEFEKVYGSNSIGIGGSDRQQGLLTLFDGLYNTKKLFIVTCNDYNRIDNAMRNRPGRFFYVFNYLGLEEEFVREYCQDNLKDTSQIDSIVMYSKQFNKFNFDMLKAIVEEMNRYKETVVEVVKYLNAEPSGESFRYRVKELVLKNGKEALKVDDYTNNNGAINIFSTNTSLWLQYNTEDTIGKKNRDDDDERDWIEFRNHELISVNKEGHFVFDNVQGTVTVERVIQNEKKQHGMLINAFLPMDAGESIG